MTPDDAAIVPAAADESVAGSAGESAGEDTAAVPAAPARATASTASTASTDLAVVAAAPPLPVVPPQPGPPALPAPYAHPGPYAPPAPDGPAPSRRVLRAAGRWTAAVAVFAVLGGAAAYAVTRPERTRIPGLATPTDGRWTFPALSLPKLPAGKPAALDGGHNPAGVHYASLRALLLPAPVASGARTTGKPGTETVDRFVTSTFTADDRHSERAELIEQGYRRLVSEAWAMPDGTRVTVRLVQFPSHGLASQYENIVQADAEFTGATSPSADNGLKTSRLPVGESRDLFAQKATKRAGGTRYGFVLAGDTVAVITQHAPASAGPKAAVTFHQTVLLQAQLLG
jgi:hypothetical protein